MAARCTTHGLGERLAHSARGCGSRRAVAAGGWGAGTTPPPRLLLRQVDVADRCGVGHDAISRLERGRVDGMTIGTLRRVFAVFDAELVLVVRWRGGEIDRLLDRRHAALGGHFMVRIADGWDAQPET